MPPRLFTSTETPLIAGLELALPDTVSRHIQVLRLQPGEVVSLFDGRGGQWTAEILEMGRKVVRVRVDEHEALSRELPYQVTLAVGMPANDRMDDLIEKATELGAHAVQPLICERAVLKLDGDRAIKKVAHWQAVAIAAAEQSGRTVIPTIHPVTTLSKWIQLDRHGACGVLSLRESVRIRDWAQALPAQETVAGTAPEQVFFLSGPEGGLSQVEEDTAIKRGWRTVSLGARVLRADTAPLAALSMLAAHWDQ